MNIWSAFPILRALVPLAVGILFGIYCPSLHHITLLTGFVGALFLVLLVNQFFNKKISQRHVFGLLQWPLWVLGGLLLTAIQSQHYHPRHYSRLLENAEGVLIGEVLTAPKQKSTHVQLELEVSAIKLQSQWEQTTGKTMVYLNKDSAAQSLQPGDVVLFQPHFKNVQDRGNPSEFSYREYLSFHLIYQQAYLNSSKWVKIESNPENNLFRQALRLRQHFVGQLQQHITSPSGQQIAAALVLGYKNDLEAELQSAYAKAGAMHVLAVSGLHVGILYFIAMWLTSFLLRFKHGRWLQLAAMLGVLWMYALLTGLSPSVMRAATMFSFVVFGKALNRKVSIYNSLACSAFLLLLLNPYLIKSAGFQLSYLAVIGIVTFYPVLYERVNVNNKWLDKLWSLTVVSVVAQLATFPLALYYFHQFPNYFLLSNVVVIPAASLVLYLGLLFLASSWWEAASSILGHVLDFVIACTNVAVEWIAQLPYSVIDGISIRWWECFLLYFVIGLLFAAGKLKRHRLFQLGLGLVLILIASQIIEQYAQKTQKQIIVYNLHNTAALNFIDANDNILYSNSEDKKKILKSMQGHWLQLGLAKEKHLSIRRLGRRHQWANMFKTDNVNLLQKDHFIQFYTCKLFIADASIELPKHEQKMAIDVLLLSENTPFELHQLLQHFIPKAIVADASNSKKTLSDWQEEADQLELDYWDVQAQGAYQLSIEE